MDNDIGGTSIQDLHNNNIMAQYESVRTNDPQQHMKEMQYRTFQDMQQDNSQYAQRESGQPRLPQVRAPAKMEPVEKPNTKKEDVLPDDLMFEESSYSFQQDFRDPLIIFVIYVILSLDPVKGFFARYIASIMPTEGDVVPFTGVVIYGLILALGFYGMKRFIGYMSD